MKGVKKVTDTWLERAVVLSEMSDWQGLIDLCKDWTKNDPENAKAWFYLGDAYGTLDRDDDAMKAYCEVVRIDPDDVDAWSDLAVSYILSNNRAEALDAIGVLRRLDPERAEVVFNQISPR